jgi:hypothetical protein
LSVIISNKNDVPIEKQQVQLAIETIIQGLCFKTNITLQHAAQMLYKTSYFITQNVKKRGIQGSRFKSIHYFQCLVKDILL